MNQIKGNIWVKLAVFIAAVTAGFGTLFCAAAVVLYGVVPELWEPQAKIEQKLDEALLRTYGAYLFANLPVSEKDYDQWWNALNGGNIRYTVVREDEEETVLYTNDEMVNADNCLVNYVHEEGTYYSFNMSSFMDALRGARCHGYYYVESSSMSYVDEGEAREVEPRLYRAYFSVAKDGQPNCILDGGVQDYTADAEKFAGWLCRFRSTSGWWLAFFSLSFLVCFVFLLCAAGRRTGESEVRLRLIDRLPFGFYLFAVAGIELLALCGAYGFMHEWLAYSGSGISGELACGGTVLLAVLGISLAIAFCMSIAVRLKAKEFWHNTILYHILRPISSTFTIVRSNVPLFAKGLTAFAVISIMELIALTATSYEPDLQFMLFFLYKLVETPLLVHVLYQMSQLKKGGMKVALGNYGEPIDTSHMIWEFKKHGENINRVGNGISLAVEERMKSERFKTELITNVSHDIKTPLTSIINYVDLMKKEEITDPTLQEYMDVLDRQSARLKKLIEDLMEASKASTGNLSVNLERCDATVMLSQVVGEFEERAKGENLELIVASPEPPVYIMADGRHLWRVLDNLMSNVCKYAMPGTRVYIDLEVFHGMVIMTFKNISRYRLNIDSTELVERFVRGDSSRNTEGSGLGLSIAQSLTALMNGNMAIQIDGDLFKIIVSFPESRDV